MLAAFGSIQLILSFLICFAISQSNLLKGGLGDQIFLPATTMSYDDQYMWIVRVLNVFLAMGFVGAAFLIIGGIMSLVSKLIPKHAPRAAQA